MPAGNVGAAVMTAHPAEQVHTFSRGGSSMLSEALREAVQEEVWQEEVKQ